MRTTKYTLVLLLSIALAACGTSAAEQAETRVSVTDASVAVTPTSEDTTQLALADVTPPMEVCVHTVDSEYDAEIIDVYSRDGMNFISLIEHLPEGTEESAALAAGYQLEPMLELQSTSWMSLGYC